MLKPRCFRRRPRRHSYLQGRLAHFGAGRPDRGLGGPSDVHREWRYGTETTASGRPYQFINQDWLNDRYIESEAFINAALGNAALMNGRLAGLNTATYRNAFHLWPLVEVRAEGDLVIKGDLDLSGHSWVYYKYGLAILSSQVPSSGAGIATLNPIAEVLPGDIDLIAPLGTIDAGEASMRVSGNVNLAALQIVNAANISVQETSSGIPTVQAPSITAALSTSNATAASQQTATPTQSANAQPSVIIVEVLGYGGGGEEQPQQDKEDDEQRKRRERRAYDPNSAFRAVGNGKLTEEQRSQLTERERAGLDRFVSQAALR